MICLNKFKMGIFQRKNCLKKCEDSLTCPDKEEICGPDYESKFSPKPFDD